MERVRQFLETSIGKTVVIAAFLSAVGAAAYSLRSFLRGGTPEAAFSRMYICTETGKPFRHQIKMGESLPIESPYSGKKTGVPAEACYWNADGTTRKEPVWVLLNQWVHKPGPTFCPDCGRLVVGHNPPARPGDKPPPTRPEYYARKGPGDLIGQPAGRASLQRQDSQ